MHKLLVPVYPRSWRELLVLSVGGVLFLAFAGAGAISHATLLDESQQPLYRLASRAWNCLVYFFPNSLFAILYAITDSYAITYAVIGALAYFVFVFIGRWLDVNRDLRAAVVACVSYFVVSFLSFIISFRLFFTWVYWTR